MSDMQRDPFEEAKELGLDCVLPGPDELFIDVDDEASEQELDRVIGVLGHNNFLVVETKRTVSKSGNTHVYLKAPHDLEPLERILLQAVLGSDRKREALAYLRTRAGNMEPVVFFEVPVGKKHVQRRGKR